MRGKLIGGLLAMAAGIAALLPSPRGRQAAQRALRPQPTAPRRAPLDLTQFAQLRPMSVAMPGSLWLDRTGAFCRVATVFSERPAQAAFGALMRVSVHQPGSLPLAAAQKLAAAGYVMRPQVRLHDDTDADIALRMRRESDAASPVVRILRGPSIKPRRASFGDQDARAAA